MEKPFGKVTVQFIKAFIVACNPNKIAYAVGAEINHQPQVLYHSVGTNPHKLESSAGIVDIGQCQLINAKFFGFGSTSFSSGKVPYLKLK
jgi:hypothetical protein